jgi:hypothetical protein
LKTARRPPHNLNADRDYRGLGLSCWLIHKKHRLRVNGQGRTAAAADALQTSCGARLYLSEGTYALVVSLRRMVVSCFGFISCLSRLLLCTHVIVAAVLLRGSPMSLRSLLMMFGSLLVHILRHNISLLF